MAGAPPVKLVSVAVTSTTPFSENERVEPVTRQLQLGAGGEGPRWVGGAELGPAAIDQLEQHQLRAAVVPPVDADIEILTAVLGSHRRTNPLATTELSGGELDLGELIAAEGLSGVDVTGVSLAWVPITTSLEIASPPTVMSVQSAPRLPFARVKSSETEPARLGATGDRDVGDVGRATVPDPLATVQA